MPRLPRPQQPLAPLALVLALAACARESPPPYDPTVYLRVGLDPAQEAAALRARFAEDGFTLRARVEAPGVSAFAMGREGETLVRVITERGVALAVSAPTEGLDRAEVGLLEVEPSDPDGDGRPEVALYAVDVAAARRCVALLRVEAGGALREVTPVEEGLGGEACVEGLRDVVGDARPEALVVVRFPALARGTAPAVALLFGGEGWARVGPASAAFYRDEERGRRAALEEARQGGDHDAVHRLAVELGALAWVRGADGDAQLAAFDGAFAGLELAPGAQLAREHARAFVARGWRDAVPMREEDAAEGAPAGNPAGPDAVGEGAGAGVLPRSDEAEGR